MVNVRAYYQRLQAKLDVLCQRDMPIELYWLAVTITSCISEFHVLPAFKVHADAR